MSFECKHCGECCLACPCRVAQHLYGIHRGDVCPALENHYGYYWCSIMADNSEYTDALINGLCSHPNYGNENTWNAMKVAKEILPHLDEDALESIIWNETGYPDFWRIPQDGWTGLQCFKNQLKQFMEGWNENQRPMSPL